MSKKYQHSEENHAHTRFKAMTRRVGIFFFAGGIVFVAIWFIYATVTVWKVQTAAKVSCSFRLGQDQPLSYVQYNIKDQASEPYFRGSIFVSLGDVPTGPSRVEVLITGARNYGNTVATADLVRDEQNKTFWMRKESDEVPLVRESGSPRDFPFDSTTISFDTKFNPMLTLNFFILRNQNPSFFVPCDTVTVTRDSWGIHTKFEMRRNPLVKMMAMVILISATLFVLIIPFSVKPEALSTSVASFFFSIWSIRGILSSEMKVFPTQLDIAILLLCVLLLLLIATRLLIRWSRPQKIP